MEGVNRILKSINKVHRAIGMKPTEMMQEKDEKRLFLIAHSQIQILETRKFNVDAYFRVTKVRGVFHKKCMRTKFF